MPVIPGRESSFIARDIGRAQIPREFAGAEGDALRDIGRTIQQASGVVGAVADRRARAQAKDFETQAKMKFFSQQSAIDAEVDNEFPDGTGRAEAKQQRYKEAINTILQDSPSNIAKSFTRRSLDNVFAQSVVTAVNNERTRFAQVATNRILDLGAREQENQLLNPDPFRAVKAMQALDEQANDPNLGLTPEFRETNVIPQLQKIARDSIQGMILNARNQSDLNTAKALMEDELSEIRPYLAAGDTVKLNSLLNTQQDKMRQKNNSLDIFALESFNARKKRGDILTDDELNQNTLLALRIVGNEDINLEKRIKIADETFVTNNVNLLLREFQDLPPSAIVDIESKIDERVSQSTEQLKQIFGNDPIFNDQNFNIGQREKIKKQLLDSFDNLRKQRTERTAEFLQRDNPNLKRLHDAALDPQANKQAYIEEVKAGAERLGILNPVLVTEPMVQAYGQIFNDSIVTNDAKAQQFLQIQNSAGEDGVKYMTQLINAKNSQIPAELNLATHMNDVFEVGKLFRLVERKQKLKEFKKGNTEIKPDLDELHNSVRGYFPKDIDPLDASDPNSKVLNGMQEAAELSYLNKISREGKSPKEARQEVIKEYLSDDADNGSIYTSVSLSGGNNVIVPRKNLQNVDRIKETLNKFKNPEELKKNKIKIDDIPIILPNGQLGSMLEYGQFIDSQNVGLADETSGLSPRDRVQSITTTREPNKDRAQRIAYNQISEHLIITNNDTMTGIEMYYAPPDSEPILLQTENTSGLVENVNISFDKLQDVNFNLAGF